MYNFKMQHISSKLLENYLENDVILALMEKYSLPSDNDLTCQAWLSNSVPKRAILWTLYQDLITCQGSQKLRILDVGGGVSMFTRLMLNYNHYTCIDLMAHDNLSAYQLFLKTLKKDDFLIKEDWWNYTLSEDYDVIVANDLFPNVDQRLGLFLNRMLPHAKQVRLSLTYYTNSKFYIVKRVDADEIMTMMAYDHRQINLLLEEFASRIVGMEGAPLINLQEIPESCYSNGRQVLMLTLKGDLYHEE